MSELIAPQQQLAAAINQLSQGSSSNRLTSEAVDVLVRQITGNQVLLAAGNREVLLPRQQLSGELKAGQNYRAILTQSSNNQTINSQDLTTSPQILRFFKQSNLSLDIPLNNNQSQSLVANLPSITQRLIANAAQTIGGRIIQATPRALTIELSNPAISNTSATSNISNQLTLPLPRTQQSFAPNQPIQLRLTAENSQLNLDIVTANTVQRLPLVSPTSSEAPDTFTPFTSVLSRLIQRSISTNLQQVVPALKDALAYSQSEDNNPLRNNSDNRQQNRLSSSSIQSNAQQSHNARLSFKERGVSITTSTEVQQATLETITPQQTRQLRALSIPVHSTNPSQLNTSINSQQADTTHIESSGIEKKTGTKAPSDETTSEAFLRQIIASGNRQALLTQVQSLIRQTRPLTESPSIILGRIEAALSDSTISVSPETTKLADELKTQLKQSLPGNSVDNSEAVRQFISGTATNLTSALITPTANNNLINGLIGLLQITLASRLNQSSTRVADRATQALAPILAPGATPKNARQQITKGLQDVHQLDQKHLLLRELSKFFASHQNHKLSSIEQQLNSQEGLYYVLPSAHGESRKDVELLIKRQQDDENDEQKQASSARAWQVSMRLDIGHKGQLLAKAKLNEKEVEVDFYASNSELKSMVFDFIPLLKERLKSLGVQMTKHQCQLGKIPDSLQRRPYQILETRV